jgi:GT2 family glycosyltransferase
MDVSILIVNYNTSALTRQTLRSVFEHTCGIDFEVIVIDNASTDGSAEEIDREFQSVRLIALSENIGFGRANNKGLEAARGRNILFLNPDTVLHDNAVAVLSEYLDTHPECGICGGNLVDGRGRPTHSFNRVLPGMATQWNDLFGGVPFMIRFGCNREFNHTRRPMEVGYISGADMMVRRSVLDAVGWFDPDFFLYYEETELTSRIRKAGYRVMNIPSVRITNLEGKSFKKNDKRSQRVLQGRELYLHKVYGTDHARRINRIALIEARLNAILIFWNPRMSRKLREKKAIFTR